jgi:hypothetical protein
VQRLHLAHQALPLLKERPDLQLVALRPPPQYPTRQIDRAQRQPGEERRADVDAPALGLDLDDASDDEVADLGGVAGAEWGDGEETVGLDGEAGDGRADGGGAAGDVCAVSSVDLSQRPSMITCFGGSGEGTGWHTSSIDCRR